MHKQSKHSDQHGLETPSRNYSSDAFMDRPRALSCALNAR